MRLCNECCCCCFLAAVPGFCSPDLLLGAAILSATYGKTSNAVLLFYTTSEVYTNFGMSSKLGTEKLLTAVHYGIASNVFVCLGEQGDSYCLQEFVKEIRKVLILVDHDNYQKLGKELMSVDELAVLDGGKCILQLRGVRPFLSDKYDITKHPNYKLTADFDERNTFDVQEYLQHRLKLKGDEVCSVYEADLPETTEAPDEAIPQN